jgi:hypothetical protein
MFYKCTKVQHKPIDIQVRDPIQKDQKKPSMLWSGAPDCPVCHRTVSGAPGPYRIKPATLGFQQAHSAIIHQTVRCATGLSDVPPKQRLTRATVDCKSTLTSQQWRIVRGRVRVQSERRTGQ